VKKSTITILLAAGLAVGNAFVAYRASSQSRDIAKLSVPNPVEIQRPVVLENLAKAYDEKMRLQSEYFGATTPAYSSTNYAAHFAEMNSNRLEKIGRGIQIIDADIAKMQADPVIDTYNQECDEADRIYERQRDSLLRTKKDLTAPTDLALSFSLIGFGFAYAALAVTTIGKRRRELK
jgi:hypothetical protein